MIRRILNKFKKNSKALSMEENNVLIISSSAIHMWELVELSKDRYTTSSDPMKLDNGDYAIVVKKS